jgi:hypothetical protein
MRVVRRGAGVGHVKYSCALAFAAKLPREPRHSMHAVGRRHRPTTRRACKRFCRWGQLDLMASDVEIKDFTEVAVYI